MSRHELDKRKPPGPARVARFLKLDRKPRDAWHRPHAAPGSSRLVQFLRIARGRSV